MLRKLIAAQRQLTIRTRLNLMAVVPVTLVLLVGGLSQFTMYRVAVNGPVYNEIATINDLAAQVSPSAMTLTGYAGALHTFANSGVHKEYPDDFKREVAKLDALQADFERQQRHWKDVVKDPQLRQALLSDAYLPAQGYFKVVKDKVIPAIFRNEGTAVISIMNTDLDVFYTQHITAIQHVNQLVAAEQQRQEDSAQVAVLVQVVISILGIIAATAAIVALGIGTARIINRRIRRLQQVAREELPRMLTEVRRATAAGEPVPTVEPIVFNSRDELSDAADAFNDVVGTAVDLAAQQAVLQRSTAEMFVNLGRRNHKLLSRTLDYITELERDERNPVTLKSLFRLDHLTTRMRRHAESLLVLAGSTPLRTWSRPVAVGDVVRAALSEIEAYERVDVEPLSGVAIRGGAVSDIAHLLAELLENAAMFSPPDSRVRITARTISGERYALAISDEGIGMATDELARANERLAADSVVLEGSRMLGLAVVSRLASRHDVKVELRESPTTGLVARVILPYSLLDRLPTGKAAPGATLAEGSGRPAGGA